MLPTRKRGRLSDSRHRASCEATGQRHSNLNFDFWGKSCFGTPTRKCPLPSRRFETKDPDVLALPGGFLFVNSGLILLAQSESELASAIAPGVGHVAARHGTRQATRG